MDLVGFTTGDGGWGMPFTTGSSGPPVTSSPPGSGRPPRSSDVSSRVTSGRLEREYPEQ